MKRRRRGGAVRRNAAVVNALISLRLDLMAIFVHRNAVQALRVRARVRASGCLTWLSSKCRHHLVYLDSVDHRDPSSHFSSFFQSARLPCPHSSLSQSSVIFPDASSLHSRRHTSLNCIVTLLRLARSGSPASTSSPQPGGQDWLRHPGFVQVGTGSMAVNQSNKKTHHCPKEGDTPVSLCA
ncbi:hypothetical protein LZ32DRAFT_610678 [Colletotrichum eremochloae]|nr:hypothetical protein LZ32DRAFT_610678 [Colletotrichum eremochloae]